VLLAPEQARELHRTLIEEVVRMLCAGVVHGDLSEYNVLLGDQGPVIIDLPQRWTPRATLTPKACSNATSPTSAPTSAVCARDPRHAVRKGNLVALQEGRAAPGDRAHRALRAQGKTGRRRRRHPVVDDALEEEARRQLYRMEAEQK